MTGAPLMPSSSSMCARQSKLPACQFLCLASCSAAFACSCRYALEEASGGEAGSSADATQRLSHGADMEQLLHATQALYAQSYYRHRSFYDAPEHTPVVDVAAVEQVGGGCMLAAAPQRGRSSLCRAACQNVRCLVAAF